MLHFLTRFALPAALLIGVWYVLSGKLDLLHFGTGVVAAFAIVAQSSGWRDTTRFRPGRFVLYVPWLIAQIVHSNLRVARMVLSRRMSIAPRFISQAPGVGGPRGLTVLASSITLTPGTLTVDVDEDEILVHALDVRSARDTRENVVANRVARVFEDGER